ncbi:hypothetical protein BaRGS_00014346 [Batillaria attramentaria]|uniref:Uncharacterized protein n=1 Tax=Batillaria attramentaria TaxID=370345 RepID=A0ABD0L612_9CAEN
MHEVVRQHVWQAVPHPLDVRVQPDDVLWTVCLQVQPSLNSSPQYLYHGSWRITALALMWGVILGQDLSDGTSVVRRRVVRLKR